MNAEQRRDAIFSAELERIGREWVPVSTPELARLVQAHRVLMVAPPVDPLERCEQLIERNRARGMS